MTANYKETKVLKEVTEKEYINTVCDKCGGVLPAYPNWEVNITKSLPYGGGEGLNIHDLCETCFVELVKLLKDSSFNLQEFDW